VYQPLEQEFLDILLNAELARFDASDLMPAAVGAGTFWSEGTSHRQRRHHRREGAPHPGSPGRAEPGTSPDH
jgi:hypothetical protein